MLGAAAGVLAGYKSLEYGINKSGINQFVDKYLPEPVAKCFAPVVAGGLTIAAVGFAASYTGISIVGAGAASLAMTPPTVEAVGKQIGALSVSLGTLASSLGLKELGQQLAQELGQSLTQHGEECKSAIAIALLGAEGGENGLSIAFNNLQTEL